VTWSAWLLLAPGSAAAETLMLAPGDDVEAAINAAQPGDELVLAGGSYELTDRFGISVHGTADAPVVVRAQDGETPHLHRAADDQNVIDVDDAEYLVLRGLEISGGSHGLRLVSARFVTVEACEIHDTGDVALSANSGGEYEGLRILRNHIHHTNNTGEGMYLGCNENACRMFDSLIEGNHVHDTNGPTVEQGDGIEIKEGSYANVVRDNVVHDTNYPCILTYSTVGNGGPNVIERNVLWNCGDHAIQSAADAVIRNNIILGSNANGIALQPHQSGAPANLVVVHNTVLHPSHDAISASGITGSVVIANNALYAQQGYAIRASGDLAQLVVAGNVGQGGTDPSGDGFDATGSLAADFVAAAWSGIPPNDVFPRPGSQLIAAGDPDYVVSDDFNGNARGGVADVGAYAFEHGGNPGWTLAAEPKSAAPAAPVQDAGSNAEGAPGSADSGAPRAGSGGAAAHDAGAMMTGGRGSDDEPLLPAQDASTGPSAGSDSSGCGCRVVSHRPKSGGALAVALLALGWLGTRRVARRAAPRDFS
jgi:hypothetical protein